MTITSSQKTSLQISVYAEMTVFQSNLPADTISAINTFFAIESTPTYSQKLEFRTALEASKAAAINNPNAAVEISYISALLNIVNGDIALEKIGSPVDNTILDNLEYPEDDLGVTYDTLLQDLKNALNDSSNTGTVAHFAAAIFYTIKVLTPNLTLAKLTDDLQATVDSGVTLPTLVNNIHQSLYSITDSSAVTIASAFYGSNVFSREQFKLAADIENKEVLYNYNVMKQNLISAASNTNSDVNTFSNAIFNALLSVSGTRSLTITEIRRDVIAGAALLQNGLSDLKANIKAKLEAITALTTNETNISNALFGEGCLVEADPHDLKQSIEAANTLLAFQYMRAGLMTLTNEFSGTATELGNGILSVIQNLGGGTSLTAQEIINDISASGDVATLASNIYTALDNLNVNTLTADSLINSLYSNSSIISGHKLNLFNDVTTAQALLNYNNMIAGLKTDINSATDAQSLTNAIYNKIGGTTLNQASLLADITQSIALSSFSSVKGSLWSSLNSAEPSSTGITNALYNVLSNAEPYQVASYITEVETALDFQSMISSSMTACNKVINGEITTALGFAQELLNVPAIFGSISKTTTPSTVGGFIADLIPSTYANLSALANAILDDLTIAFNNRDYTSAALNNALFSYITPSDKAKSYDDLVSTEIGIGLYDIKTALTNNQCAPLDSTTTCAQSILATLLNGNNFTPTLAQSSLKVDLEATLASGIDMGTLMSNFASNLGSLHNNALTANAIASALYNENALVNSNPYRLGQDLVNAEQTLIMNAIYDALVTYLTSISTSNVDTSAISMAKGILSALNINGDDTSNMATLFASDISFTASQEENLYSQGLYEMAQDLLVALNSVTNKTSDNIVGALLTVIRKTSDTCVDSDLTVAPEHLQDGSALVSYINQVVSDTNSYPLIKQAIINNLNNLSPNYQAGDVASAIISALSLSGDYSRMLSSNMLIENITATGGNLTNTVATLISALSNLSNPSSANDILSVLFESAGDNGVLADSLANLQSLSADITTSIGLTNDYGDIITQLDANLSAITFTNPYNTVKSATASAIFSGMNTVANGANGIMSSTQLPLSRLLEDIDTTCAAKIEPVACVSNVVSEMRTGLGNLAGAGISADGISSVIFDSLETLEIGTVESGYYRNDLESAAASHSSLGSIKNSFSTVGTYDNSLGLANALLSKIGSSTSIASSLTQDQLSGDIASTLANNNALTLQGVANSAISAVYNAPNTASGMAQALFNNVLTTYNSDSLKQDVTSYELAREPQFYAQIANTFVSNFNYNNAANYNTESKFANLLVSTLNLDNPNWTAARVLSDVYASSGLISNTGPLLQAMKPGGSTTYPGGSPAYTGGTPLNTADDITNAMYSVLTLSTADKQALKADIATPIALYGGATGLAAKVNTALSALTPGYSETAAAQAIVQQITPTAVNASPLPSVLDMVNDFSFTEGFNSVSLTDIVSAIQTVLLNIISNPNATSEDLNTAFYNVARLLPSNSDKLNYENDVYNSATKYNNYQVIKTALQGMDTSSASATAASILSILQLPINDANQAQLVNSLTNSITTNYADLMAQILSNLSVANIVNVDTAADYLSDAFYSPNAIQPQNQRDFVIDITNADEVDNAVSLVSVIGTGVCRPGASHIVYSCSASNGVKTVGPMIAQNDCSIGGLAMAKEACVNWSLNGEDHYVSFDGITCSNYLGEAAANLACQQGLDYIAV